MTITELFNPKAIAAYWEEVASNAEPYIGSLLFPARKKLGLDLKWLKGSKGLPVSLMPSAFDAKATFRDRPGLTVTETEMPFFREGFKIKEKDRQDLLRIADSADPYASQIIDNLFDDARNLIDGAAVVPEREIMQLLFAEDGNAGISIKANGVVYTYNYDPNGTWKTNNYFALTGTHLWSAPSTSDPFSDIKTAKNAVRSKTGTELTIALMNSNTFNMMAQSDAIKNRFLSTAGRAVGYISDADVVQIVRDMVNVQVAVYDKQYLDEDGTVQSFVPDGYVSLLPAGAVGATWFGTTPEEADLMGKTDAQVSVVNTGIAVTQIIDQHPVNVNTFASEIVLPSWERMDECALLKVIA